jgi:hypothetical protein
MMTPPRRTALGILSKTGLLMLGAATMLACGDPSNPRGNTGTLAGVVRDAATDATIEGVAVVVAGIGSETGSDGRFEIDRVPEGTHQVAATMAGYVAQTVEAEIQTGATTSLSLDLVGDPGPASPLTITTSALPTATVDVPYETILQASGGSPPYRWQWVSNPSSWLWRDLPPGLTLDDTGSLAGTPEFPAGPYPFRIQVIDAEAETASADLTVEVESASGLRVMTVELSPAETGQPYSATLQAEGGSPPYAFQWNADQINKFGGLSLDPVTGIVSGSPVGATGPSGEPLELVITVGDVVGASAIGRVAVRILPGPLVITSDLPDGRVEVGYLADLIAAGGGGFQTATWTVASGVLPPGLSISHSQLYGARVSGIPTAAGNYQFTLQVSESGLESTRDYTVVIADRLLSIATTTLPDARVGTAYSVFLVREGGTGPYQWEVVSGTLPAGISLSTAGELNGTPATAGDASFEVRVRDALGQDATASLALHVEP